MVTYEEKFGLEKAKQIKEKIGKAKKGQLHTEETKQQMSLSHLGKKKILQSITMKEKWKNPDFKLKMSNRLTFKGHNHTLDAKENIRKGHIGRKYKYTEDSKANVRLNRKNNFSGINSPMYGKHHSEENKTIISNKIKQLWKNEDFARGQLEKFIRKPSNFEFLLDNFLQQTFPKKWQYVGNGTKWFTINGKHYNPDFIDLNREKKIIEFNGWYMHNKEEENNRELAFARLGFKTLFLHPKDLQKKDDLFLKIKEFGEI